MPITQHRGVNLGFQYSCQIEYVHSIPFYFSIQIILESVLLNSIQS